MKNSKTLFDDFVKRIQLDESPDEIAAIAYLTFEKLFGVTRTHILSGKDISISAEKEKSFLSTIDRINKHEPIQYILGEAEFLGRKFLVNESVLIPRPETEELVRIVIDHAKKNKSQQLIDIGTGSGCIPISLALELNSVTTFATDISEKAIEVAKSNANFHGTKVSFFLNDILNEELPTSALDVIVSNPPYIALEEKDLMRENVIRYEPHVALFAPAADPLIFYRTIIERSRKSLNRGGLIAFEINERFSREVRDLFSMNNFSEIQVVKDISGKDRFVLGRSG